jgi:hypothetical protein
MSWYIELDVDIVSYVMRQCYWWFRFGKEINYILCNCYIDKFSDGKDLLRAAQSFYIVTGKNLHHQFAGKYLHH